MIYVIRILIGAGLYGLGAATRSFMDPGAARLIVDVVMMVLVIGAGTIDRTASLGAQVVIYNMGVNRTIQALKAKQAEAKKENHDQFK